MSERVRVLVELGGSVYAIGTVNASLAMRRAGDPRFDRSGSDCADRRAHASPLVFTTPCTAARADRRPMG